MNDACFLPDVVVVYCRPGQLRHLLLGLQYKDGYQVTTIIDPNSACVQSVVPAFLTGDCQITVLCGGDYVRALAREDEIIFSVPAGRMADLMLGMRNAQEQGHNYMTVTQEMKYDFFRPDFYETMERMLDMKIDD